MMRWTAPIFAGALTCVATAAGSHPHIFVKTEMALELDATQHVTGIRMSWTYDSFFSLLIFEDLELDRDADGQLTQKELDLLMGFDLMEWPEGFEGDLYLETSEGAKVEMPRPIPVDIEIVDGEIKATQFRKIPRVSAEGLKLRQYDPTYYVEYDVSAGVTVPRPCSAVLIPPDLDQAEAEIARLTEQAITDDLYVEVQLGHLYATTAVLTCDG